MKKSKGKIISVKVYFRSDNDLEAEVIRRIENINRRAGLSLSAVAGLAIRYGLGTIEQGLPEFNLASRMRKSSK